MHKITAWSIAGVLLFFLIVTGNMFCKEKKARQNWEARYKAKPSITDMVNPEKIFKDDSGRTHYVIKSDAGQQISQQAAKSAAIAKIAPFIDSTARALDINPSAISNITNVTIQAKQTEVPYLRRKIDSLENELRVEQTFSNRYLTLKSRSGNLKDSTDNGSFDYVYNAEVITAEYYKQKKFLGLPIGRKVAYTDFSLTDSNATVMGVKKYSVIHREPAYGLRIQATGSWRQNDVRTGLGARLDAGRFSFYGGYLYDWGVGNWVTSFSTNYDIIRF